MLPPEPDELMLLIYSCEALNASEKMEKCNGGSNCALQMLKVTWLKAIREAGRARQMISRFCWLPTDGKKFVCG
jgi:hypothetical protein